MQLVISHASAFRFWRAFTGHRSRLPVIPNPSAMDRPPCLTDGIFRELAAIGLTQTTRHPLDLLFSEEESRSQMKGVRSHATRSLLPEGSLVQISEHVSAVCPELAFLQLQRTVSREKLILAGYELCGTYAQVGPELSLWERRKLTTTDAIRDFAACVPRLRSVSALKALDFVREGAASPMEAKAAMLLSLPTGLGGYGLPLPVMNPELVVPPNARLLYQHATVRPDLYWPDACFDLEYDGREAHDADAHWKDAARLGALAVMNVDVLTLTAPQLFDAAAFHEVAQVVAAKIGHRLRIRREDFPVRATRLREELGLG